MAGKNKKKSDPGAGVLATNRKAQRDYHILEQLEAGIILTGTEVKSVKLGHVSIQEGYVHIDDRLEACWSAARSNPMSRATFSTTTRPVNANCCFTARRSSGSTGRSAKRG